MTRLFATLVSGLLLAAAGDSDTGAASRWRHNPRARTDVAIDHQAEGELEAAGEAFDTALDLAPSDPLLQFNAGTAALLAAGGESIELLRTAAETAPPDLEPHAHYNLGNAYYASHRFTEAIESYKQTLRLDPGNLDAKHNLELAQRRLEKQQQEQQQQSEENEEQQSQQEQEREREQQQEQDPDQPQQQPDPDQQQRQQQKSPLPDFEDQPDMTAEQAAAILEAVENLEREQRRKQAMEQLKRAKGDRDW